MKIKIAWQPWKMSWPMRYWIQWWRFFDGWVLDIGPITIYRDWKIR